MGAFWPGPTTWPCKAAPNDLDARCRQARNGFAALKPATLYRSPAFAELFLLPDLLLLQLGLLRLGMDHFVQRLISLFGLSRFWSALEATTMEDEGLLEQVRRAEGFVIHE